MELVVSAKNTDHTFPYIIFATNNEYVFDSILKSLDMESYCSDYVDVEKLTQGYEISDCVGAIFTFPKQMNYFKEEVNFIKEKNDYRFNALLKEWSFLISYYDQLKEKYEFVGHKTFKVDDDYKENEIEKLFEIDFSNSHFKNNHMKMFKEWYKSNSYLVEDIIFSEPK